MVRQVLARRGLMGDDALAYLRADVGNDDPYRLVNATANDTHVSLAGFGNTLTITRDLSWVSALVLLVSISDGKGGTDSESFTVFVTA